MVRRNLARLRPARGSSATRASRTALARRIWLVVDEQKSTIPSMRVQWEPIRLNRECSRSAAGFRKTCCSRFLSYPPRIPRLRKIPRTFLGGPFGQVIRATRPMAKANPFRFSAKYHDDETDLPGCGYRYYSASTRRWLSKDPLGEMGGVNLYYMTRTNPIDRCDQFGLDDGDSFFMMFIEFPTHTGSSMFTGYTDSIWNSIMQHDGVISLCTDILSEATHVRNCCEPSRKTLPGRTLIFREVFFRWRSWGGLNAGVTTSRCKVVVSEEFSVAMHRPKCR